MNSDHNTSSDKVLMKSHQAHTEKYQLLKVVGQGSFGTVFKAVGTANGKRVAIKYINM